jgi:tRNA pseudouridine55 synthase
LRAFFNNFDDKGMNILVNTGFLLINKPVGMTSFGCIGRIKKILKQKIKIGHAGTLDPFASGLLVVAIGREATRLIGTCMAMKKTYVAVGKCGELTDTLDRTGSVVETCDFIPDEFAVRAAVLSFGSSYVQTPPLYSALQHEGQRLYALVRQKLLSMQELQEVAQSKARMVQLYDLKLINHDVCFFTICASVSQGTYIRTLVNDIAVRAGSCATTYELTRTVVGDFSLEQAVDLSALTTVDDINRHLIPISRFMSQDS